MATKLSPPLLARYEQAAYEYSCRLKIENLMEARPQATQREITLESLALLKARRADVHVFNELLIQYPRPRQSKLGQVVPDNMVVLSDKPIKATTSFNLPFEPAGPFWVLEYVSKGSKRKDYEENHRKYERELRVPYYLVFYSHGQKLTLYHHNGRRYVTVKANEHGRYAIPELELEVGLLDGWVRYWNKGQLLPLPAEMQRELSEAKRRVAQLEEELAVLKQRMRQNGSSGRS